MTPSSVFTWGLSTWTIADRVETEALRDAGFHHLDNAIDDVGRFRCGDEVEVAGARGCMIQAPCRG